MARNNMTIVIKVKDDATAQIKAIEAALKGLGASSKQHIPDLAKQEAERNRRLIAFRQAMYKQRLREETKTNKELEKLSKKSEREQMLKVASDAKKGVMDMTQFNKTMFTTAAFVGLFTKAFRGFAASIEEAADLDRLDKEYQRVFGDSGALIKNIKGFTTTAVDRMDAMRSAIALGQLGIAKNSGEAAELIGMAATAAKMAGKNTSEGISKVTEALKTGSLGALEFLNEIRGADPALKAYLETLNRAGGALGGAMTAQARYNLILNVLRRSTQGHLKDERDLVDVITDVGQSFGFMRMSIGRLLGSALGPFIDKISIVIDDITQFIDRLRTSDKTFPSFIKNITLTVASLGSLLATTGTLRLLIRGLSTLGIGGVPLLAAGFLGLGQIFGQADSATESLMDTFKMFGSVAAGVFQLVQSFIMDPENFAKGIGKMDKSLHDFLAKKGLLNLTDNIAKVTAAIVNFSIQVGNALKDLYNKYIGPVVDGLGKLFGLGGSKPMGRQFLGDNKKNNTIYNTATKGVAIGIAALAGNLLFKNLFSKTSILGGLFSKIPLIGKVFTPGQNNPKGTASDPIHVVTPGGILGGNLSSTAAGGILEKLGSTLQNILGGQNAAAGFKETAEISAFSRIITSIKMPFTSLATSVEAAALALASPTGFIIALTTATAGLLAIASQTKISDFSKGPLSSAPLYTKEEKEANLLKRIKEHPEQFRHEETGNEIGINRILKEKPLDAFSLDPYVQANRIISKAEVPNPTTETIKTSELDTLSQDIKKLNQSQREELVSALTDASEPEKQKLFKTVGEATLPEFINAFEEILKRTQKARYKAQHAPKARSC